MLLLSKPWIFSLKTKDAYILPRFYIKAYPMSRKDPAIYIFTITLVLEQIQFGSEPQIVNSKKSTAELPLISPAGTLKTKG
jgi:hypothetical protein